MHNLAFFVFLVLYRIDVFVSQFAVVCTVSAAAEFGSRSSKKSDGDIEMQGHHLPK